MRGVSTEGEKIIALRRLKGFTQEQLAMEANVDVATLRKMEKGKGRFDFTTIAAIAEKLGIDFAAIVKSEAGQCDNGKTHIEVVHRWHAAFLNADVEQLVSLHTDDTILQIPGADGLPAAGNFTGLPALRQHLTEFFERFRLVSVCEDDFLVHAADNMVFLRTTASIAYLPSGKTYTARHVNEFEFRDFLIARRTTVADYGQLRELI